MKQTIDISLQYDYIVIETDVSELITNLDEVGKSFYEAQFTQNRYNIIAIYDEGNKKINVINKEQYEDFSKIINKLNEKEPFSYSYIVFKKDDETGMNTNLTEFLCLLDYISCEAYYNISLESIKEIVTYTTADSKSIAIAKLS